MNDPSVRARHLKATLASVDRLPEGPAIRRALPVDHLAAIEAAHGQDWLPIALDVGLVGTIQRTLGPDRHDQFSRAVVLEAMDGPLLGTLVRIAISVFGHDPARWVGWIPKAWQLMFRDCGRCAIERSEPGEVRLTLAELPEICLDEVWLESVASSLSALLARAQVTGRSTFDGADPTSHSASYALRWSAR
jgi:hypothetical protein